MAPTLLPGDRLLVCRWPVRIGDLVAVSDPRAPARVLVKRIADRDERGFWLLGDAPDESTDSRTFGWVEPGLVLGKVVYRYGPAHRSGSLVGTRAPTPGVGEYDSR